MKKGLLALFYVLPIMLWPQIELRCKGTNFVGHMQIFINFLIEKWIILAPRSEKLRQGTIFVGHMQIFINFLIEKYIILAPRSEKTLQY